MMTYDWLIQQRRALRLPSYQTLADVGFDGPWVSPYQKTSRSPDGPVLLAFHWLDAPSIRRHHEILQQLGYLPRIRFNRVLDLALSARGLNRQSIYVTQAFQLIPAERSQPIPREHIDVSFDTITRHELAGRQVLALGHDAANACTRHAIPHIPTCHPSRRGKSNTQNAHEIATALAALGY